MPVTSNLYMLPIQTYPKRCLLKNYLPVWDCLNLLGLLSWDCLLFLILPRNMNTSTSQRLVLIIRLTSWAFKDHRHFTSTLCRVRFGCIRWLYVTVQSYDSPFVLWGELAGGLASSARALSAAASCLRALYCPSQKSETPLSWPQTNLAVWFSGTALFTSLLSFSATSSSLPQVMPCAEPAHFLK